MNGYTDLKGTAQPERSKQISLRDIFDDVVRLVEPYFQHGTCLNGHPTVFWAAKTIRDEYADLSSQEVQISAAAVSRSCREHGAGWAPR